MSDKQNKVETTINATDMTVTIAAPGVAPFSAPVIVEHTPAREVKKKTGLTTVKEKNLFRLAPFTRASGLAFAAAIFAAAEAKNTGDGDKLAEKIFGKYVSDLTDAGQRVNEQGQTIWDEACYGEGLYTLNRRKSAPGLDDLRAAHGIVLEQAVSLSEVREEWRNALTAGMRSGAITVDETGNPSVDPFSPAKWEDISTALNASERLGLNLRLDSFAALTVTMLNIRDRRIAIEREIAELETKRAEAEAKRKAAKAKKEADAQAAALTPVA